MAEKLFVLDDYYYEQFRALILKLSGISFSSNNRSILEGRLRNRLRVLGMSSIESYYKLIQTDEAERSLLLDEVTTNLTHFFRNLPQYKTFTDYVIPDLIQYKQQRNNFTFRLWSAGCSTGEEAYTNAMILKKYLPPNFIIEIVASDLSLSSLLVAKAGFYPDDRVEGVPEEYLSHYFQKVDGGYEVKDEIKKLIFFDYHNLKNDTSFRNFDVIFCRNVLIYFDIPSQEEAMNYFYKSMTNHSYLFIGHSESLFSLKTSFEFEKTPFTPVYKKFVEN